MLDFIDITILNRMRDSGFIIETAVDAEENLPIATHDGIMRVVHSRRGFVVSYGGKWWKVPPHFKAPTAGIATRYYREDEEERGYKSELLVAIRQAEEVAITLQFKYPRHIYEKVWDALKEAQRLLFVREVVEDNA